MGYYFLDTYCTLLLIDRREVESAGEIINMSGSFSQSNKRKEDARSRKLSVFIFASLALQINDIGLLLVG